MSPLTPLGRGARWLHHRASGAVARGLDGLLPLLYEPEQVSGVDVYGDAPTDVQKLAKALRWLERADPAWFDRLRTTTRTVVAHAVGASYFSRHTPHRLSIQVGAAPLADVALAVVHEAEHAQRFATGQREDDPAVEERCAFEAEVRMAERLKAARPGDLDDESLAVLDRRTSDWVEAMLAHRHWTPENRLESRRRTIREAVRLEFISPRVGEWLDTLVVRGGRRSR